MGKVILFPVEHTFTDDDVEWVLGDHQIDLSITDEDAERFWTQKNPPLPVAEPEAGG